METSSERVAAAFPWMQERPASVALGSNNMHSADVDVALRALSVEQTHELMTALRFYY
jgi:SH3-like domain-containing protein